MSASALLHSIHHYVLACRRMAPWCEVVGVAHCRLPLSFLDCFVAYHDRVDLSEQTSLRKFQSYGRKEEENEEKREKKEEWVMGAKG